MMNTAKAFSTSTTITALKRTKSPFLSSVFLSKRKDYTLSLVATRACSPCYRKDDTDKLTSLSMNLLTSSCWSSQNNFKQSPSYNRQHDHHRAFDGRRLYSTSVKDMDSIEDKSTTDTYDENGSEMQSFFEGEWVSFVTAGDGIGLAAVKVKDDDIINSAFPYSSSTEAPSNVLGIVSKKISSVEASKKDGIGQGDDLSGRTVIFKSRHGQKTGIIVAQRHPVAFVLCNFDSVDEETTSISILQSKTKIQVSTNLVGKVINCFGEQLLDQQQYQSKATTDDTCTAKEIFSVIPKLDEISLINSPLLTGITTIDAVTPIGKGQNMLIIGDDKESQRSILIDILSQQVKEQTKCVYACTSSDELIRTSTLSKLKDANLLDKIVTVCTRENIDSTFLVPAAAEAVAVAASACSIAETFANESGEDTLVIVDVLDYHKDLWDSTTRTLVDLYGKDSVVKGDMNGSASSEMRAYYSGLVQRSAKFNKGKGGGSITLLLVCSIPTDGDNEDGDAVFTLEDFDSASQKIKERIEKLVQAKIPLTASILRKIQIPVPVATENTNTFRLSMQHIDDLISMSDGQIWLVDSKDDNSTKLMLDVQRSITRIGIGADTKSRADAPALQALTGGIRFELAQSLDAMRSTDNKADRKSITKRDAWLLAMYQDSGQIRTLSEECVALLAVKLGMLDDIVNNDSKSIVLVKVQEMLDHVWNKVGDDMKGIDETLDFTSDESKARIEKAIEGYFL